MFVDKSNKKMLNQHGIAHGGTDSFPFLFRYHKYHTSLSISHGQLECAFSRHKILAILKNKRNEDHNYTFLFIYIFNASHHYKSQNPYMDSIVPS